MKKRLDVATAIINLATALLLLITPFILWIVIPGSEPFGTQPETYYAEKGIGLLSNELPKIEANMKEK